MTYSILAWDPETGAFGAAVASRFFAVGALCIHGIGHTGALSTQALVNPMYGPNGLKLLAEGMPAEAVVARLVASDPGIAQRQLHVIDNTGAVAQHTGADCVGWAGHKHHDHVSVAGNMLAGPDVLDAMLDGFQSTPGTLATRLLASLQAGENAGGDKRGRQSAALLIYEDDAYSSLDIRADDHPDPLSELRRLHRVSLERYAVFRRHLAGRSSPWGELDRTVIDDAIRENGQPAS